MLRLTSTCVGRAFGKRDSRNVDILGCPSFGSHVVDGHVTGATPACSIHFRLESRCGNSRLLLWRGRCFSNGVSLRDWSDQTMGSKHGFLTCSSATLMISMLASSAPRHAGPDNGSYQNDGLVSPAWWHPLGWPYWLK
jgi:hypothetical protein